MAVCRSHQNWYFCNLSGGLLCYLLFPPPDLPGRIGPVNDYLADLAIKTNDPDIQLKRIKKGVENLTIVSALDLPGVLLQGASALGGYSDPSKGLPIQKTKKIQRTIALFFAVVRQMKYDECEQSDVDVRAAAPCPPSPTLVHDILPSTGSAEAHR
jgi:hypothetical protein